MLELCIEHHVLLLDCVQANQSIDKRLNYCFQVKLNLRSAYTALNFFLNLR